MEDSQRECASAASAYRQGDKGRQVAQGTSLATPADPLVQRQSPGGQTSDRKPRQEHSGSRSGCVERSQEQMDGHTPPAATRVYSPSPAQGVYPETQRDQ